MVHIYMNIEEIKKYIIQQIKNMDENDIRFTAQISTFIKKYQEGKRGH